MNVFEVFSNVRESGEYILGARETGSHACYLIYGVLHAGESGRELKPGEGHEEIVVAVQGDLRISGHVNGVLREGQAIHLRGEERCEIANPGEGKAAYFVTGGHSGTAHC